MMDRRTLLKLLTALPFVQVTNLEGAVPFTVAPGHPAPTVHGDRVTIGYVEVIADDGDRAVFDIFADRSGNVLPAQRRL